MEAAATPEVALKHATQLLRKDPTLAAEQAQEILRVVPGHPPFALDIGRRAAHRGPKSSGPGRARESPLGA